MVKDQQLHRARLGTRNRAMARVLEVRRLRLDPRIRGSTNTLVSELGVQVLGSIRVEGHLLPILLKNKSTVSGRRTWLSWAK